MNARRDEVAEHIYALVQTRAKEKGCRVKKLQDTGARDAVINGAAWRLERGRAVFGNIRDYIEGGFWFEDGDARDKLIDRALDADLKKYIRAGRPADHVARQDIGRYAEELDITFEVGPLGQPLPANSVLYAIEREEDSEDEAAAEDAREQEARREFEIMREAINAYSRTLNRVHRKALFLICNEPKLTNSTIAAQVGITSCRGISPATVSKIRDKFGEMAGTFLALKNPEDVVETLLREVQALKKDVAVLQAERRRDWFLRDHSADEFEALRAWAAPLCDALNMSVDELLGSSIAPKAGDQ